MKKILSTIIYLTPVKVVSAGPLFCLPIAPGSTEGDGVEGPLCEVAGSNFHKALTLKKKMIFCSLENELPVYVGLLAALGSSPLVYKV